MIRPLFNLQSPTFTGTSTPTQSTALPDMTSPATSGRHLSKFEKPAENAAFHGFESNFSGVLPAPPIGGLLVSVLLYYLRVSFDWFSKHSSGQCVSACRWVKSFANQKSVTADNTSHSADIVTTLADVVNTAVLPPVDISN